MSKKQNLLKNNGWVIVCLLVNNFNFMKIIGILLIGGVVLWLFIITLPFVWWLWILIVGFVLLVLANDKKEKKIENNIENTTNNCDLKQTENNDEQIIEEETEEMTQDYIDEDTKELMKDHNLDKDDAERVLDIMDEYGVDEDDAIMIQEEE